MRIAIIDFETTSANRETARPWGWAVTFTDGNFNIRETRSGRMWSDTFEDITPEAMRVCRLTESRLPANTPSANFVMIEIAAMLRAQADVVMAYNADFDRSIFENECKRQGVNLPHLNWVCAMRDVEYEDFYRCKQLSHLCFDHGIHVAGAHDAASDTEAVAKLLNHRGVRMADILAYRDDPWVYMRADLPKPWGPTEKIAKRMQAAAKEDGYGWQVCRGTDAPIFEKTWVKRVKKKQFEYEKEKKLIFKREEITL